MPDNQVPDGPIKGSNMADVLREAIRAVRDILNDWRVATGVLIVILVMAGSVAGPDIIDGVERWIRAWRCQG